MRLKIRDSITGSCPSSPQNHDVNRCSGIVSQSAIACYMRAIYKCFALLRVRPPVNNYNTTERVYPPHKIEIFPWRLMSPICPTNNHRYACSWPCQRHPHLISNSWPPPTPEPSFHPPSSHDSSFSDTPPQSDSI